MFPRWLTCISAALLISLPGPAFASECYALAIPVAAGEYIDGSEVRAVPCLEQAANVPLTYDRGTRALRASAAIAAGDYLGPLVIEAGHVAQPSEELVLVFREGPVTIERNVRPLAPMRSGEEGFVRAGDGTIFTATFVAGESKQ